MDTYHKITTLWKREDKSPHNMLPGTFANPEFDLLSKVDWVATEKVDGTNIRVIWDGHDVFIGGKTNNAQIPALLLKRLEEMFLGEANEQKFEELFGDTMVCIYGEGYGKKIQKGGGNYSKDSNEFVAFDVKVGNIWLKMDSVEDISKKLDIDVVPVVYEGSIYAISDMVEAGFKSSWGDFLAEGVVARPKIELNNRMGQRVIAKLKHRDFVKLNQGKNREKSFST